MYLVVLGVSEIPDNYHNDFTFRSPWPYYGEVTEPNAWPWLSAYPQKPGYIDDNKCDKC